MQLDEHIACAVAGITGWCGTAGVQGQSADESLQLSSLHAAWPSNIIYKPL